MTVTAERDLLTVGLPVYSIFLALFAAGTTLFELNINGNWLTNLQQGDTIDLGDCHPTRQRILVRTQPALAGLFSQIIVSHTPSSIERA